MKKFDKRQFKNPSEEYSVAPFWFLNGELEFEELKKQLFEMKQKGVDKCILHSRKGTEVEYLSEEWFEKIGFILEECEKLSIEVLVYDEDNWPSGYAGGRLTSENPSFAATCLSVEKVYPVLGEYITVEDIPGKEIECVIAVHNDDYFLDITDYDNKKCKPWKSETLLWEVFVFRKEKCGHRPAYSPFPYVDLLNPNVARAFVRATHEEYKKRFPDKWGKVIKGFFTDEPGFYQNYLEQCKNLNTVIWTDDFAERFIKKFGYDIRPHLCCLWQNMGAISVKTRCDYYTAVAEFYKESYFDVISAFLHKDGLIHIGHLHREDYVETLVQTESDFFSAISALDASGIDCIDKNPARITERLGSSAAHIYGKEICFSETFGGFGWSLTPEDMKRRTDLQYVQGINTLVPHAFFYSTDGIRKTESPPSLFFQNGYWKYFKQYADYAKRLSYIGRAGEFSPDAAVYFPVETSWAEFRPLYRYTLHELDEQLVELTCRLNENGVCFDFLNDFGVGEKLNGSCGIDNEKSGYKSIILPFSSVIKEKTLEKICEFASRGGFVFAIGDFSPTDADGLRSASYEKTLEKLRSSKNFIVFKKHREEDVVSAVVEKCGLAPVYGNAEGVLLQKRIDGVSELDFFVNTFAEERSFTVERKGFSGAEIWNAETGDVSPADFKTDKNGVAVKTDLKPYQSTIIRFSQEKIQPEKSVEEKLVSDITDGWSVCGEGNAAEGTVKTLETLKPVEKVDFFSAGKHGFSGEVTFYKKVSLTACEKEAASEKETVAEKEAAGERVILRLDGAECAYASAEINGEFVGARLWSPFEFDITKQNKNGENEIKLTLGSTEENRMTDGDKNAGVFGAISVIRVKS